MVGGMPRLLAAAELGRYVASSLGEDTTARLIEEAIGIMFQKYHSSLLQPAECGIHCYYLTFGFYHQHNTRPRLNSISITFKG